MVIYTSDVYLISQIKKYYLNKVKNKFGKSFKALTIDWGC